MAVRRADVPAETLIARYVDINGAHVDAYRCGRPNPHVTFESYVAAFFRTPVFRLERRILAAVFDAPSSERQVLALAEGTGDAMAAWSVEDRRADELLLAVADSPIRTWLALWDDALWFGSAVLPGPEGRPYLAMRAMLPFHALYSRILLSAARRALS